MQLSSQCVIAHSDRTYSSDDIADTYALHAVRCVTFMLSCICSECKSRTKATLTQRASTTSLPGFRMAQILNQLTEAFVEAPDSLHHIRWGRLLRVLLSYLVWCSGELEITTLQVALPSLSLHILVYAMLRCWRRA